MHPILIGCVLVALATACTSTRSTLPTHTATDSVLETDATTWVAIDRESGEIRSLDPNEAWIPVLSHPDILTDGTTWRVGTLVVPKADAYFRSAGHHWFVYGNRVVSHPLSTP